MTAGVCVAPNPCSGSVLAGCGRTVHRRMDPNPGDRRTGEDRAADFAAQVREPDRRERAVAPGLGDEHWTVVTSRNVEQELACRPPAGDPGREGRARVGRPDVVPLVVRV